jgi:hypothetical protein
LLSCTPTFFAYVQKINYRCSNCIYVSNYRLANYIFSLYAFPYAHFENDDECGNDLTNDENGYERIQKLAHGL